jgi:ATP-binding cassette subfamily B protein
MVALAATTGVAGASPVLIAWLTRGVLNHVAAGPSFGALLPVAAGLAAAILVTALVPHFTGYLQADVSRRAQLAMQDSLFQAVNREPGIDLFETPEFHDRLYLAQQAGERAPADLLRGLTATAQAGISVGGFLLTLLSLDARLAVLALIAACPNLWAEIKLSRTRGDLMWQLTSAQRRRFFFSAIQADAQAAKEVRLFGLGDFLRGRMLAELRTIAGRERARDAWEFRVQAGLSLLAAIVGGAGLLLAVERTSRGQLSVGDLAVVIAAFAALQSALGAVVRQLALVHEALLLVGHYDLITTSQARARGGRPAPPIGRGVELRDVWFRYGPDQPWVLSGMTLRIAERESVALVGLNGAGKSTVVKLLCGLLEPTRGQVLWDGADLQSLSPADVRRRIGVVFQDFMAYDLSARENIGVGDIERDFALAPIHEAARLAGMHESIERMPRGYETQLTRVHFAGEADDELERGVLLSGGQWQRVAVARAFLRRQCDLLILDEPSSGLDAEAEHAIHEQLRAIRGSKTSLLISHRLSAVRLADRIAVLDQGRVVENGAHAELIAQRGLYARLFELQASGYQSDGQALSPHAACASATDGRESRNNDAQKLVNADESPVP